MLLNFAKLPQLRGAVKSAVAERSTSEELRLSDNDADSHYSLILELPLWSCVRVTCVKAIRGSGCQASAEEVETIVDEK